MRRLLFLLALGASSALAQPGRHSNGATVDGIRIVEVLPTRVTVDEEQEIFVRVRYELKSRDTALLQIGFNARDARSFGVYAKETVAKGEGETVMSARVTPRDWGKFVFFQVSATLADGEPTKGARPLAMDFAPIAFKTAEAK